MLFITCNPALTGSLLVYVPKFAGSPLTYRLSQHVNYLAVALDEELAVFYGNAISSSGSAVAGKETLIVKLHCVLGVSISRGGRSVVTVVIRITDLSTCEISHSREEDSTGFFHYLPLGKGVFVVIIVGLHIEIQIPPSIAGLILHIAIRAGLESYARGENPLVRQQNNTFVLIINRSETEQFACVRTRLDDIYPLLMGEHAPESGKIASVLNGVVDSPVGIGIVAGQVVVLITAYKVVSRIGGGRSRLVLIGTAVPTAGPPTEIRECVIIGFILVGRERPFT